MSHFLANVNDLFEHTLQNMNDSDMVWICVHNEDNQNDKPIGISFRRKDQLSGDGIWIVFEKVAQSNSRFNALDKLVVIVHSVRKLVGFGGIKTKGGPLAVMTYLKGTIVEVKAENNCLAHALIIAISNLTNDRYYVISSGSKNTSYIPAGTRNDMYRFG